VTTPRPRLLAAVFLVSAVMLFVELTFPAVLLFLPERRGVTTIIAVAMLGLGWGGLLSFLVSGKSWVESFLAAALLGFALSIPLAFAVAVAVPWRPALILALSLPFAAASAFLSQAFVRGRSGTIYFMNLGGSGLGALLVFFLEPRLGEENCLILAAALAGAGAWLYAESPKPARAGAALLTLALLGLLAFNTWTGAIDLIRLIPKSRVPAGRQEDAQSYGFRVLQEPGARLLASARNLVARVDAIAAPDYDVSRRFFTHGLTDVQNPEARREYAAALQGPVKLYFLDHLWSQLATSARLFAKMPPYPILDHPAVLIIGPGGGVDIAKAADNSARRIVAVEINPGMVELMQGPLRNASGNVYGQAEVQVMDGRTYVRLSRDRFDLIHLAFADLYVPFLHSDIFLENYLYTEEAFADYFDHLTDHGLIAVHKWVKGASWNRDLFRLASTSLVMLKSKGVPEPARHLFMAGGEGQPDQYYGYLLIKKTPFTDAEAQTLEATVAPPFQIFHSPLRRVAGNPFAELIGAPDLDAYLAAQTYDLSPTTDDRPFFYLFDRGLTLHRAEFHLFLAVLIPLGFLPFLGLAWRSSFGRRPEFWGSAIFFVLIALGYMFLQTTSIQRWNLFLGSPILSLAVVVTSFLLFAGLGSLISERLSPRGRGFFLALVPLMIFGYHFGLGPLLDYALVPSLAGRIAVTIAVLAPLCFALGFPFPLGMEGVKKQLGENSAALMFALNGFGSAGAVALFTRLAPVTGLRTLHLAAGVLYALAAVLWLGLGGFRANRP
jgi:MFS family permease